jgi:hypothetical protein
VLYVDLNSTNPISPYTNWVTAATNIQDAVDAASAGDQVLVTNGLYQTGGRVVYGSFTNRVAVTKAMTVESVNGPATTMIVGSKSIAYAVRCAYLTNGAVLVGFTLTNGSARTTGGDFYREESGGGVWAESDSATVSNCVLTKNLCVDCGGGAYGCTLNNCTLTGNNATDSVYSRGGGAYGCTLNNCTLLGNSAREGGGSSASTLNSCTVISNSANVSFSGQGGGCANSALTYCTLMGNSAFDFGGGSYAATLNNCKLMANSAQIGGGANYGFLCNCTLTSNTAAYGGGCAYGELSNCTLTWNGAGEGGGCDSSVLNNCTLSWNSAGDGGGSAFGALNNCTLTGNSASKGGGCWFSNLTNCIVWGNDAPSGSNNFYGTLFYTCTAPLAAGAGNIASNPLFIDAAGGNLRLQSNSLCINVGCNACATYTVDLDGRPRIVGSVDMGAYEFQGPGMGEFIGWLQGYGLATDGSADLADTDGDGMNNWQEWMAGTVPINAQSVLRLVSLTRTNSQVTVTWQSVTNRTYALERAIQLGSLSGFLTLATNLSGRANTTTYTDTNTVSSGMACYRVAIQAADYHVQSAHSIIPFTWMQRYGLPTDGSTDFADSDHDGMNNWQEWMAGTDPTDALSALRMRTPSNSLSGVTVRWQSATSKTYYLQRGTNLLLRPRLTAFRSNLVGHASVTSFTDTSATNAGPYFYRVGVQ